MIAEASPHPHIHPVDSRRHLGAVADIIETCFSTQMDDEGRSYVRQIRRMAERAKDPLAIFPGLTDTIPVRGFVWEENGVVAGNLTLIPFMRGLKPVYLIANVAVRPEFRQRGIGRQLTEHAVAHVRQLGAAAVWLHVRDDNPVALRLYQNLGFTERARRTTWNFENLNFVPPAPPRGVQVGPRRGADWARQLAWLQQAYPPEVGWNLPFTPSSLSPRPWQALKRWLSGLNIRQWAARRSGELLGVLAYEPTPSHYDWLWLACRPEDEAAALGALLPAARIANRRRPLLINYPAGQAAAVLEEQGFAARNTLIWMEIPF